MEETVTLMLDYFTPKDNVQYESEFHEQFRDHTQGSVNNPDDREFNLAEIRNAV